MNYIPVVKFVIFNVILISFAFWIAYRINKAKNGNGNGNGKYTFLNWFNQGKITPKGLAVSLIFGIMFGFLDNFFLWMGVDKMMAYIPGGILTKSAWGNTYSDFIGATIGAAIASIGQDLLNVDNTPPIWINAVGMVVGCIMGMTVGKLITGEK